MKVLKFYADWCGPCKMLSNILADVESPVEIEEIDIDVKPEIAIKYHVRGVPTLILIDDAENVVRRQSGVITAEQFKTFVGE